MALREEDRLCLVDEERQAQEPQIICSLGLIAEDLRGQERSVMPLDIARVRHYLRKFRLPDPVHRGTGLGTPPAGIWSSRWTARTFTCRPSRRSAAWWRSAATRTPMAASHLCPSAARSRRRWRSRSHEHLIIFTDAARHTAGVAVGEARAGQADRLPRAVLLPRPDRRSADPEAEGHRLQHRGRSRLSAASFRSPNGCAPASTWSGSPNASTSGSRPSTPPSSSSSTASPMKACSAGTPR